MRFLNEGMPLGRPCMMVAKMFPGSLPYIQLLSINGGPMPPPPWAWQPTQLYCSNSFCPSATEYALSSYMFEAGGTGISLAPGFSPLICTVLRTWFAGDGCRKMRSSLEQETSNAVARSEEHTSELQSHSFISYA